MRFTGGELEFLQKGNQPPSLFVYLQNPDEPGNLGDVDYVLDRLVTAANETIAVAVYGCAEFFGGFTYYWTR